LISFLYKLYITTICILITETEDFDDSVKDKDWKEEESSEISSESSDEQGIINEIINEICESAIISFHIETQENIIPINKNSKKRLKNIKQWSRNVKKTKLNLGQAYINNSGKQVNQKQLLPPCDADKCKFKCTTLFTLAERSNVLNMFWRMGDITSRRAFIIKYTSLVTPKYKYIKEGSKRLSNNAFSLPLDDVSKRVCKKMFMATLCISDKFIRTTIKKSGGSNFTLNDLRGKHDNHRSLDPELVAGIQNHINSFPRIESHYLRNQTSREFIDGSLTLSSMHNLYIKECEEKNISPVKLSTYSHVFNTKFNIGFFVPKKDQCGLCEKYNNSSDIEKQNLQDELEAHKNETKLSRFEKEKDKKLAKENTEKYMVSCYDLQSVLTTPAAKVSNFYYARKFATYNLTVYSLGENEANCFVWNEDQGKRGANEISTCIYKYLIQNCLQKDTIFYSDNCSGQQKNKFMISLYLYAINYLDIPSITHKFLIVGHTQNEGDSVHSTIEKQKNRLLRGGSIFSPLQWPTVIQTAKKTGKPFKLNELTHTDFIDFKQLSKDIGNNFNKNTTGQTVLWRDIKIIKVTKEFPDRFFYKTTYGEADFKEIIVLKKTRNSKIKSSNINLKFAFSEEPGITQIKKKDLISLCEAKLIPDTYHSFYKNLKVSEINNTNNNEESD